MVEKEFWKGCLMVKIEYCVCPLCARNRVLQSKKKGRIRWDLIDPLQSKLLQVREQHARVTGGSCEGFPIVESECLTLEEMMENPEYDDIIQGIKLQTLRILQALLKQGIVKKEELE